MPIHFTEVHAPIPGGDTDTEYGPLPLRLAALIASVLVVVYAVMRIPRS